ncbi:ParB/RepB/Spo0J family partition protein [Luteimonas huabeiensis]|uniref:ParB/RepB/Spo0J family partition protein n=1 Tax=Luteimonas huabeiensis TaxID=1244513 RepID=UPI0004639036|nr:ParB/RepB/Spo0J family partition protein [Luteimonas huabeiensis]
MNAIPQSEARAIQVPALETADPTKNLILVPLSRLVSRPTGRNVRKTPRMSIPELAASIQRVGLLQNLIVITTADGEHYEVVAGGRRLAALKLLAKKHRISKEWEVPCLLVADGTARTASLTENVQREAMHPADQFEAFAALVAEGRPIEDIAADFGVSPLVVQRRLKLANVSPRLLADYRGGAVTLEQLMALTITDDHAAQESAFYGAPEWQRGASPLRERLTEREIDASHPLVRFAGLDAYTAAGGGIRRDLFAEGDAGTYLTDAALLETLVRSKLDALAGDVRAEGWAWVEAVPHMSYAERQAFQNAPRQRREPKTEALEPRREQVAGELQAVEEALQGYAPDVRAVAGAIVTLDRSGEAVIHCGLLREAEAKALRTLERLQQGFGSAEGEAGNDDEGEDTEQPKAATLVHGMVRSVLQDNHYGHDLPLGVSLKVQDRLEGMAPDWPESPAAVALRELQQVAGEALPEDSAELFAALLAKPQDELVRLLAVCVASTVDVVTPRAMAQQPGAELAQAVRLDMAAWWKPTADGYFQHVPKAAILEAVEQYAPAHITRLAKLKKGDIASEAERLANGTSWMPAIFKAETSETMREQDNAPADAEAMADELTQALAA